MWTSYRYFTTRLIYNGYIMRFNTLNFWQSKSLLQTMPGFSLFPCTNFEVFWFIFSWHLFQKAKLNICQNLFQKWFGVEQGQPNGGPVYFTHIGITRPGWVDTLRPREMDAISQTTFSSAFSWIKMFEFQLKYHWSVVPKGPINNIPALV